MPFGKSYDIIQFDGDEDNVVNVFFSHSPHQCKARYRAQHDNMALAKEEKKKIIEKFAREKGDTGSPEVQVALLSAQIDKLAEHLKEHGKDIHSRRGLLSMVAKRRRLLSYLSRRDKKRYENLKKELNIK